MRAHRHSRRNWVLGVALVIVACSVSAFFFLSNSTSKQNLMFYSDATLTVPVEERQVFSWPDASLGWNNKTLWVQNAGSRPFYLGLHIVLPEGWNLLWDYDNSLIRPGENRSITFSAYVPEPSQFERVLSRVGIFVIMPEENTGEQAAPA